ncbi:HalOD1 output domain-containing protein [Halorientalis marina]|jgi:hypothetical protein|uniref:HalOD1 output domain-containing protein n=1 Tax=Halorientalis marina TaxID=2931976 RepID=UPI001FF51FAA|nr:HalOD1 output domain-containing protein [Halorientalis marina]
MVKAPETYDVEVGETVSEAVVRAVANEQGVDPVTMDACLYDVIDPHALDTVFADRDTTDGERRVSFTFDGYRVAVDESRTVFVTEQETTEGASPPTGPNPAVLRGSGSPWRLVVGDF